MQQSQGECAHCIQCIPLHHLLRREEKIFSHSLCLASLLPGVEKAVYPHKTMQNGGVYAARQ